MINEALVIGNTKEVISNCNYKYSRRMITSLEVENSKEREPRDK